MSSFALAAGMLAGSCGQALAGQEVAVGRLGLRLPGDGWQVHSMDERGNTISGDGHSHQQSADYKVIVHRGADQRLDAVLLVRANASGIGRFSGLMFSDAKCGGSAGIYAEGDKPGPAARSYRCLQVVPPQMDFALTDFPEDVRGVLSKQGWKLPPTMFVVSAVQYATTGAFAVVVAYLRPLASTPAADDAKGIPETLPFGVTATSVQWGRQLQEAVSDSVYSIRGKLALPDLQFADETKEPQSSPVAPPPPAVPARAPSPPSSEQG